MRDAAKLWVVLARAHGAMRDFIEQSIAATGLGLSDFMVLEVLLHKGPLPVSEIARKVLLANASMTAAADRLERRGLVLRQASAIDRRSRTLALTDAGCQLIEELYARHAHDIQRVAGALTAGEQTQMYELLKKLGYAAQAAAEA